MKTFKEHALLEVKLSRVFKHIKDDDTTVVIFTAFRGDKSIEQNKSNNKTIAGKLRNNGFGFFYVDGYWIENEGKADELHVKEDSIFVTTVDKSEELIQLAHKLANNFKQDAIFVKDTTGAYILYKSGKKEYLKSFTANKIASVYTKLKTNKVANSFVFESERDDIGFINRLSYS